LAAALPLFAAADTNTTLSEILAERPLAKVTKATDLIGHDVRDAAGEKFGDVNDVALDLEAGRILFAVVSIDGEPESADRLIAVPAGLLAARENYLVLKADKSKLKSAPAFDEKSSLSPEFVSNLNKDFRPDNPEDSTGANTNGNGLKNIQLAKSVFGMPVLDSSNGRAGDVKDLALDWNSERIPFVIISPAGVLKLSAVWYPVPPGALKTGNGKSLSLTVTGEQFVAAPQFRPGDWANLSDLQWAKQVYTFYRTPGYFETALQPTGRTNALERIYHEP
jgi:sporulation protein YlmC with PRC-barrel domain